MNIPSLSHLWSGLHHKGCPCAWWGGWRRRSPPGAWTPCRQARLSIYLTEQTCARATVSWYSSQSSSDCHLYVWIYRTGMYFNTNKYKYNNNYIKIVIMIPITNLPFPDQARKKFLSAMVLKRLCHQFVTSLERASSGTIWIGLG